VEAGDLEARLDGGVDRPLELLYVTRVGGERRRGLPGFLVELARYQQRLALDLRVC
jgi:hypothetical protein